MRLRMSRKARVFVIAFVEFVEFSNTASALDV